MILKEQTETSTGIRICDTRGHLLMNNFEVQQFNLIVEGKVKDNSKLFNPILEIRFYYGNFGKVKKIYFLMIY